ncbi:MAG: WS/DGAT/MGAT family O-acyltransferase [Nocardioidaceae bacterium]
MPQRLSPTDVSMLAAEASNAPRHVATVAVLDPGADGFDYDQLVSSIHDRIAFVPRYRQRVMQPPGGWATPVWVDDDDFDLTYHVRRSALPRPGSMDQLRELVARLVARALDRDRPLWEAYIVEGLEGGRVALLIKSHQALVDGTDTVDLAQVLLEESPEVRDIPGENWHPERTPTPLRLLADSLADSARHPRRGALTVAGQAVAIGRRLPLPNRPGIAPDGPLWAAPSRQRRFSTLATRLDDYRRVRDTNGGTINDVVLAAVAGGLRSWLLTRGEPVHPTSRLRALVPLSVVDDQAEPTSLGSHVRGHLLSLPIGESNPVVRLHQVSYSLKAHKATGQAVAANKLAALPGFAPTTFHALGARLAQSNASNSYALVVTNVPGPQEPLYVAGARMVETYPVLPLVEGHAIAIGVTSYEGGVFFGIDADRDAVPDADVFATCIGEALAELVDAGADDRQRAPRGRGKARGRAKP